MLLEVPVRDGVGEAARGRGAARGAGGVRVVIRVAIMEILMIRVVIKGGHQCPNVAQLQLW